MKGLLAIRYLILMMGLFAAFCGFMYNDFMSIPLFIFKSCYNVYDLNKTGPYPSMIQNPDCVYPIGLDPAWYLSLAMLTFANSLKMKLAVIFGVLQMGLGVCMKAFNALHKGNKMDFFLEFVP